MFKKYSLFLFSIFVATNSWGQEEDLLRLLDSTGTKKTHEKIIATFKGEKIINAQSTETVKAKTLDFSVAHRFGNIGEASNGGLHTLYGLDNSADIRLGFAYGITNNITIGVGRSKQRELVDGSIKYKFLSQTIDNHVPLTIVFYGLATYCPQEASQFYSGTIKKEGFKQKEAHRFAYTSQLLIARKFGWRFSMQLMPTYQHRNFVVANINPDNNAEESNDLFSMGAGARLKITKRFAIIADYYYTFSKFRTNNSTNPFYAPLAIGFEIETGGHVFNITFTNAAGIIENNYLPYTNDDWLKGGFKLGFNISRVFNIGR